LPEAGSDWGVVWVQRKFSALWPHVKRLKINGTTASLLIAFALHRKRLRTYLALLWIAWFSYLHGVGPFLRSRHWLSYWRISKTFYRTRRFITVFTRAFHWYLTWARSIQSIPLYPTALRFILILSSHLRLFLHSGLFPSGFPNKILHDFLFCPLLVCSVNYRAHDFFMVFIFPTWFPWTFLMMYSKAKLKSNSDKASPCFRPFSIGKVSDSCLPNRLYHRFHLNVF
jgi:hypothetical protein